MGDRMEAGRRWWGEGEMSEDEKRRASLGARVSPSSLYSELKIKKKKNLAGPNIKLVHVFVYLYGPSSSSSSIIDLL